MDPSGASFRGGSGHVERRSKSAGAILYLLDGPILDANGSGSGSRK